MPTPEELAREKNRMAGMDISREARVVPLRELAAVMAAFRHYNGLQRTEAFTPPWTDRWELGPGDSAKATEARQPNPAGGPPRDPLFPLALVCRQSLAGIRPKSARLGRDPLPSLPRVR
jgi:hypothetical protein